MPSCIQHARASSYGAAERELSARPPFWVCVHVQDNVGDAVLRYCQVRAGRSRTPPHVPRCNDMQS